MVRSECLLSVYHIASFPSLRTLGRTRDLGPGLLEDGIHNAGLPPLPHGVSAMRPTFIRPVAPPTSRTGEEPLSIPITPHSSKHCFVSHHSLIFYYVFGIYQLTICYALYVLLFQTGAGRQPVSAMKKQTLDHTRPESPMLRGQGQVGAIPDLPPSLSGGNNNNKLPKMARSDEEESLSSSGIPRLTLNVDEGDNRRLPKAAPDAGPNEEEDPDWVLSDLETLQKELDARKLPHRERGDSPMDSAASEQKETSAKGKGHNMLTPRDIDLDMAFGGGED